MVFLNLPDDIVIEIFTYIPLHENNLHLHNKHLNSLLSPSNLGNSTLMKLVRRLYVLDINVGNQPLIGTLKSLIEQWSENSDLLSRSQIWECLFYGYISHERYLDCRLFKYAFTYQIKDLLELDYCIINEDEYKYGVIEQKKRLKGAIEYLQSGSYVLGQNAPYVHSQQDIYLNFKGYFCDSVSLKDIFPEISNTTLSQRALFVLKHTKRGHLIKYPGYLLDQFNEHQLPKDEELQIANFFLDNDFFCDEKTLISFLLMQQKYEYDPLISPTKKISKYLYNKKGVRRFLYKSKDTKMVRLFSRLFDDSASPLVSTYLQRISGLPAFLTTLDSLRQVVPLEEITEERYSDLVSFERDLWNFGFQMRDFRFLMSLEKYLTHDFKFEAD